MAAAAGDLATFWSGLLKLLPCNGSFMHGFGYKGAAELTHRMRIFRTYLRELSSTRSVYPGVERLCIDIGRARPHVE